MTGHRALAPGSKLECWREWLSREVRIETTLKNISSKALPTRLRVHPIHRLDAQETIILLRLLRRSHLPHYHIAGAQAKAPNLGLRDINVFRAGLIMVTAQIPFTIVHNVQHAATEHQTFALGFGLQQTQDKVLFFEPAITRNSPLSSQISQFGQCSGLQSGHIYLVHVTFSVLPKFSIRHIWR